MGEHGLPAEYQPILGTLRIMVGALMSGVVVFLCIAIGLQLTSSDFPTSDARIISYAAIAVLAIGVVARAAVLSALATQGRKHIAEGKWRDGSGVMASKTWSELVARDGDKARLLALYQSRTVIGAAVLELPGLFGCVAHLLEGSWIGVGVAVVSVGLILTLQFPTGQAASDWLADQSRRLEDET